MRKPISVILILFALMLMSFLLNRYPTTANDSSQVVDPAPGARNNETPYASPEDDRQKQLLHLQLQLELQKLLEKIVDSSTRATHLDHHTGSKQSIDSASSERTLKPQPDLSEQLLKAGVSQEIIKRVLQRVERNRFSLLELRQQARSEGWIDSPEYIEKSGISGDPTRGIREEFGDLVFDHYLYFSGRPNRVQLKRVQSGSIEEYAGLQAGDIITRYASNNIYSIFELRRAFQASEAGDPVLLEFLRNGQPVSTTVPRGSLDISLQMMSLAPDG